VPLENQVVMPDAILNQGGSKPQDLGIKATVTINGYMVVRLVTHNGNPLGGPAYTPKLGNIYYGGIERMPWFDVNKGFWEGLLPENIKRLWSLVKKEKDFLPGICITQDLNAALSLLNYSNQLVMQNELIAIYSDELIDAKGFIQVPEQSIRWLGYDVIALPDFSILHAGIFASETPFLPWKEYVNEHGLFDSLLFLENYIQAYEQASVENGPVEEVWRLDWIARVKVGKVLL
jgi:hypothetical protein